MDDKTLSFDERMPVSVKCGRQIRNVIEFKDSFSLLEFLIEVGQAQIANS